MRSAAMPRFSSKIPGFISYVILSGGKGLMGYANANPSHAREDSGNFVGQIAGKAKRRY